MLAENGLDFGGVFGCEGFLEGGVVERVEKFGAEGADVIEVEFEGVDGLRGCGARDELLAGEFGGESHREFGDFFGVGSI